MINGITSVYHDLLIVPVIENLAADTEDLTGTTLDMTGYEGVCFIVHATLGEVKAGFVLKAQQDSAAGMGTAADLLGTSLTGATAIATGCTLMLDIKNPKERYVRCILTVPNVVTAVAVVGIAIKYNATKCPVTQSYMTTAEFHVEPAEGTA